MEYGFWSDGTPCRDDAAYINEYFEGREFRHRELGHAVIQGYGEYVEGQGNMFAITAERCAGRVFVTLDEFLSDGMQTQINLVNRLKFAQFFIRSLADSPKRYKRDRDAYMRVSELEQENTIHSSTE